MLLNIWSIALLVSNGAALFMGCGVLPTAIRVLRFWDGTADTTYQIQLEKQTWLSALLVQYLLFIQIISLLLLILAADNFSETLVGAMCATGAFLAGDYGLVALYLKIAGVFLYGFWIVLHRLDLCSEYSPLVRFKYFYFLAVFPFLAVDSYCLFIYLLQLEPEIITSCCGVIFSGPSEDGRNLLGPMRGNSLLYCFYGGAGLVVLGTLFTLRLPNSSSTLGVVLGLAWLLFFLIALLAITLYFSSYIYAMPSHRCPFDILQREYNSIGYPIYISLFTAVFCGASAGLVTPLRNRKGLKKAVEQYQRVSRWLSLVMILIFGIIVHYFPLIYRFGGGEI